MNFYDYYQPGEQLDDTPVYLAAKDIIHHGMQVIPLKKGEKEPANIKSVHSLLAHPIHDLNIDFYFKDRDVDIGIILQDDMEFIDVDGKNKEGLLQGFLAALEYGWPELHEKLVIDFTPNNGCHLIYRSEVVGGRADLAKKPSFNQPVVLIERINKFNGKQYIKVSPSVGYNLKQGSPLELPFLTAEERNWLGALAVSFNETFIPEVSKKEAEREDSPWSVYNKAKDWQYIADELTDRNWQIVRDYPDRLVIRRPGDTSQRSSGVIFKDTNTLYLYTTSTEFENAKPYSPFGVYCLFYHDNNVGAASRELAKQGIGKNIYEEGQFWKRHGKKIHVKYTELLGWLHGIGYRMYNNVLVQVVNNVVRIVDENTLKRVFLNEIEFEVVDDFYERVSTIFSDKGGLAAMIDPLLGEFIKDDKLHTWLFFKNTAIKISGQQVQQIPYNKLVGLIWETEIIDKDFYPCEFAGCDAQRFIDILGGSKPASLQKIIGYSISRYKDKINPRAVVLMEDIDPDDEGESQGGSGKGLLFDFVRQFRKTVDLDGKNFRFHDPFLYQNVEPDTAIIFIDDVEKNFKFAGLYSVLTGSLQINRKNKPQIIIPFDDAPKIVITSNFSVGAMDISSARRKYEFAVQKHFGADLSPIDEFGRQFFYDWDGLEWAKFYNFIINCCQLYLNDSDYRSINNVTENSTERSLISSTNRDFIEYMDGQHAYNFFDFCPNTFKNATVVIGGQTITNAVNMAAVKAAESRPENYFLKPKSELLEKIQQVTNNKKITPTMLTQWFKLWAKTRGVTVDGSYKKPYENGRYYRIIEFPTITNTESEPQKPIVGNPEFPGFNPVQDFDGF